MLYWWEEPQVLLLPPWLNPRDWKDCLGLFWTPEPTERRAQPGQPHGSPQEACGGEKCGMGTQEVWVARFSQDQLGDLGPVLGLFSFLVCA